MSSTRQDLHVIIGAGPLGLAIARHLTDHGSRVRLVTRGGRAPVCPSVECVAADVMRFGDAVTACAGAAVVYQCAGPRYDRWTAEFPTLQENVLQGAARAGAVLVAAENLYGYGVAGELHEDIPHRPTTRKGQVRAAMSARLFEAHARGEVRTVSGRASDFFGPGVRTSALGERFWPELLGYRAVSWFGDADAPHSFTYVPDFARALVRLGGEEAAWGRAWHVPSPSPLTLRELVVRAAAIADVPVPAIRRTPKLLLRGVGLFVPAAGEMIEMAYSFDKPFVMSHAAYATAFGGTATGWDAALAATIEWWRDILLPSAKAA
jgi:nucleoside-diphosphate-sugar epimerase